MIRSIALTALALGLAACQVQEVDNDRPETAREFPRAYRPVSELAGSTFSTEEQRDDRNEANTVMDLAQIRPGMTVADIGAGEGYYTVRLAERVGERGRVLAQDIDREVLSRLGDRVVRERLDNVSIKLGAEDDPRLPEHSFDRIFMVHMYHEVTEPYAFLWRLRPAQPSPADIPDRDAIAPTSALAVPKFGKAGIPTVPRLRYSCGDRRRLPSRSKDACRSG